MSAKDQKETRESPGDSEEIPYWEKGLEEMTEEERKQMARDHQDGIDTLGIPEGANYLGAGEYTFAPTGD